MRPTPLFILLIFLLQSCGFGDQDQTVRIGNKYTLTIPSHLMEAENLNDDASLQYQNPWKEFYVIVIDETKKEMHQALVDNYLTEYYTNDIEGYTDLILESFKESLQDVEQTALIDTTVNQMSARITTIAGTIDGLEAYYAIGLYESKKRYYQVLAWTLAEKKSDHHDRMMEVLYTLQELKKTDYREDAEQR